MGQFDSLPSWALGAIFDLVGAIVSLATAKDDAARKEALMQASEALKARLDQEKFGGE